MKKNLLFIPALFFVLVIFAQSKSEPYKWSFTVEAGINQFDGDMTQFYNDLIPDAQLQLSYGGSAEYTFNPFIGLGVEFYHSPLSAKKGDMFFTSNMNYLNGYLSVNILNLLSKDMDTKWALYGTLGIGIAAYNSVFHTNNADAGTSTGIRLAQTIPVGVVWEYNFTKFLALGVKAQYRAHNKDNLEGNTLYDYKGVTNDFIELGTVQLRWKLKTSKREHVRNLNSRSFYYEDTMVPVLKAKAVVDSLQGTVDSLRRELDIVKPRIERIEAMLKNISVPAAQTPAAQTATGNYKKATRTTDYNDRAPEGKIKKPNAIKNTSENNKGETIQDTDIDNFGYVFFELDKTDLSADAYAVIKLVAEKMKTDPSLKLEIHGFADYVGDSDYNQRLSQSRSDVIRNVLVNLHGIDGDRITSIGKGKLANIKSATRMNRRCVFYFIQ